VLMDLYIWFCLMIGTYVCYPRTVTWSRTKILHATYVRQFQEKNWWEEIQEFNVAGCCKYISPSLEKRDEKYQRSQCWGLQIPHSHSTKVCFSSFIFTMLLYIMIMLTFLWHIFIFRFWSRSRFTNQAICDTLVNNMSEAFNNVIIHAKD